MEDGDDFLDEKVFKRWQDDRLSREDFKVDEMIEECYSDLECPSSGRIIHSTVTTNSKAASQDQ